MKISLAWLNTYLDAPVDGDEAQRVLTDAGFPLDARDTLPDGDELLDVEVTSNRGDCLSHVGVAREVAAASGRRLASPASDLPSQAGPQAGSLVTVDNAAREACPVYTARVIRGVKVGPSPAWLRQRLESIGLRAVNNVVDVTNFVLHELGQPLHAFDLAKLAGPRIVVRSAAEKEPFIAIDGSTHALPAGTLVIADAARPVAVAGVMGGRDSEVGLATTDVLLESAVFAPLAVRRASRALRLASDSSYRFERGVDPCGVERASRRAAALIVELAGGTLAEGVVRAGDEEPEPVRVTMRLSRCRAILGRDVSQARVLDILGQLQLEPSIRGEDDVVCRIPTFRRDLTREIDLIEEVARLDGYERIVVEPRLSLVVRPPQASVQAVRALRQVLVAHGYHETVTFSFVSREAGGAFLAADAEAVVLDDARRKAEPMLRPSLVPSLLGCRKTNQNAGNAGSSGVRLFETAATYRREVGRIVETRRLALLADVGTRGVQEALRDLRGTLAELAGQLQQQAVSVEPGEAAGYATAGRVGVGGSRAGVMGVLAPAVLKQFDLQDAAVAAELDLDLLLQGYPPQRNVSELARYPGIARDLTVVVAESVPWRDIEAAVHAAGAAMLESVGFGGTYRGKPIDKGHKSVTIQLRFGDPQRTLRHDEVDPQVQRVLEQLQASHNATLRL